MRTAIQANREHRARLHADSELAASRQRLAELAQHLQTSIEMERAAIAREIHDDVGGSLTALKFDLAWIGRHAVAPEVQLRVTTALETLDQAGAHLGRDPAGAPIGHGPAGVDDDRAVPLCVDGA